MLNAEQSNAILATIKAAPEQFDEACSGAEDPDAFSQSILEALADAAGEEVADEEGAE
jgi:hypothetical protein